MMPIPVRRVEKNSVGIHLQINSLAKPRRVPTRPHSGQVETRLQGSLAFVRAIDQAAACMYELQHEVLAAQGIPVQGIGREAYRS